MSDDLELFTPEPRIVRVRGLDPIHVLPLRVRQISAFTKSVEPVLPLIASQNWVAGLKNHTDDMVRATAIATGTAEDVILDLYPDDLLRLVTAVFEVNLSFFAQHILPAVTGAAMGVMKAMDGQMPLPFSGETATDLVTAST